MPHDLKPFLRTNRECVRDPSNTSVIPTSIDLYDDRDPFPSDRIIWSVCVVQKSSTISSLRVKRTARAHDKLITSAMRWSHRPGCNSFTLQRRRRGGGESQLVWTERDRFRTEYKKVENVCSRLTRTFFTLSEVLPVDIEIIIVPTTYFGNLPKTLGRGPELKRFLLAIVVPSWVRCSARSCTDRISLLHASPRQRSNARPTETVDRRSVPSRRTTSVSRLRHLVNLNHAVTGCRTGNNENIYRRDIGEYQSGRNLLVPGDDLVSEIRIRHFFLERDGYASLVLWRHCV